MDKPQFIHQTFWRVTCLAKTLSFRERKSSHRSCQRSVSPPRTNRIDPDSIICPLTCEVLIDLVYCSDIDITPIVKTEVWIPWNLLHIKSWAWTLSGRYSQIHQLFMMTISMKENIKQAKGNEQSDTKVPPPYPWCQQPLAAHNPSPHWCNCHIGTLCPQPM